MSCLRRRVALVGWLAAGAYVASACSIDDGDGYKFGSGGASGNSGGGDGPGRTKGGTAASSGGTGNAGRGGAAPDWTGGETANGGTPSEGGGAMSGGTAGDGAADDGAAGDGATGGRTEGGSAAGGNAEGGSVDGSIEGGSAAGGSDTGGSDTGGSDTGGSASGGTGGSTTGLTTGKACEKGSDCQSSHCVDGVCCASICNQVCSACSNARTGKADGTCAAVEAGLAEAECNATAAATCGNDGTCNGAGACSKFSTETVCAAASCTGRQHTTARKCNGLGTCGTATTGNCAGNLLCGAEGACLAGCTTSAQCVAGNYCNSGACVPKKASGECGAAGDDACTSARCAGGSCCTSVPCSCAANDARDLLQGRGHFNGSTLATDSWTLQGDGDVARVATDATSCPVSGAALFGVYSGIETCVSLNSATGPFKLTARSITGTQADAFITCGMNFTTKLACDLSGTPAPWHAEVTAPSTTTWTSFELANIAPPAGSRSMQFYCEGMNGARIDQLTLTY